MGNKQGQTLMWVKTSENVNRNQTNVTDTVSPGQIVWRLSMINRYLLCSGCPLLTKPDTAISPLFLSSPTRRLRSPHSMTQIVKKFPVKKFPSAYNRQDGLSSGSFPRPFSYMYGPISSPSMPTGSKLKNK